MSMYIIKSIEENISRENKNFLITSKRKNKNFPFFIFVQILNWIECALPWCIERQNLKHKHSIQHGLLNKATYRICNSAKIISFDVGRASPEQWNHVALFYTHKIFRVCFQFENFRLACSQIERIFQFVFVKSIAAKFLCISWIYLCLR